ncbi:hypothetical protein PoB_003119600 [Plakobranchus ocellatus]|uniref:Uncharacterized protein n=1 Tax=Plakobranchus ocellatus TaxID=259542 RepID=A0AAV4A0E6_9GAST|nr:hypothetical protein PoB_003119600 [Plakobranchus ocellatus]
MAYPGPRNPEENFPQRAIARVSGSAETDGGNRKQEVVSPRELLLLVVAALRVLDNQEGSTMSEIRRVLVSGGYLSPSMDVRPALILGLKRRIIRRPLSAVKAGVYGRYVEVEAQHKKARNRRSGSFGRQTSRRKQLKRRHYMTTKEEVGDVKRYRLAI